jgi:hypothetical protein
MKITDFINQTNFDKHHMSPRIICNDGFEISVQASEFHHCSPGKNNLDYYTQFEVGYPSEHEILLDKYKSYDEGIYNKVPGKLVNFIIVEHNEIDINKTFKNINNNKKEFIKNEKI